MDITAQQSKVDDLKAQVATGTESLAANTAALNEAQAELDNAVFINQLEALTPDQLTAVNEALASDADNKSGITLSLPPATV
jgi:hypothetical protein